VRDVATGARARHGRRAPLQATVHRVVAAARFQLGDEAAGRSELDESLRVARAADAVYEVALALDLAAAVGGDAAAADESSRLLERLGVERVARPPLPTS
jgi:hypothetical protein